MSMFIQESDYFSESILLDVDCLGRRLDSDIEYRKVLIDLLLELAGRGRGELRRQIRDERTLAIKWLLGQFNDSIYSVQTYDEKEVTMAAMIAAYSLELYKKKHFATLQTWWYYKANKAESAIKFENLIEFFEYELWDDESVESS